MVSQDTSRIMLHLQCQRFGGGKITFCKNTHKLHSIFLSFIFFFHPTNFLSKLPNIFQGHLMKWYAFIFFLFGYNFKSSLTSFSFLFQVWNGNVADEGNPIALENTAHHRRSLNGLPLPFPKPADATLDSSQHLAYKSSKIQESQHACKSASTSVRLSSFSEPHDARMKAAEPYRRDDPAFVLSVLLREVKAAKLPE